MKKTVLLALSVLATASASAQISLVKETERAMKGNVTAYPQNIENLKPAFTNPESAEDVYTWYVAGKGAMDFFDNQQVMSQMNKEIDKPVVGHSLIDAYGYLHKALPLDSIPDAKGKVKAKYSKDIYKMLTGHYLDLQNAAIFLWEAQDYPGAVEAWQLFVDEPTNPALVKAGITVPADTIIAEIYYNMGIGNSLAQNNEAALHNFRMAIAKGYNKKNAYDYAISAASQLKQPEVMAEISEMAYPLFGAEDSRYIGFMINNLIEKKQFDQADQLLDQYIAADPMNSQLYFVKGVLYESEEKPAEALASYRKSIELDPNNAQAEFRTGYMIYQEALNIDQNEGGGLSQAEYLQLRKDKVDPKLRDAATYIEKSFQLDENISDAPKVLRSIYYNLNDEENLKRVEAM